MGNTRIWVAFVVACAVLGACSSGDDDAASHDGDAAVNGDGTGGTAIHAGSGGQGSGGHVASAGSGGRSSNGDDAGSTPITDAGHGNASDAGSGNSNGDDGLHVAGNQLLGPDGRAFRGRGANLHDTRSCNACTSLAPDVAGLDRWSDALLDDWGANLVRFDLEAYAGDDGYRMQWKTLTDEPDYLDDVLETVTPMTAKPGVYVLVTLFTDPSIKDNNGDFDSEWAHPST